MDGRDARGSDHCDDALLIFLLNLRTIDQKNAQAELLYKKDLGLPGQVRYPRKLALRFFFPDRLSPRHVDSLNHATTKATTTIHLCPVQYIWEAQEKTILYNISRKLRRYFSNKMPTHVHYNTLAAALTGHSPHK